MAGDRSIGTKKGDHLIVSGRLSDDELKLFIDVERISEGGTRAELEKLVSAFGTVQDIHTDVLDDIIATLVKEQKVENRRVARGKAAEPGRDGKVLVLVKPFVGVKKTGKSDEEQGERKSLSDLHLFDNIEVNQVVARVYPPHAGKDGISALGKPLRATQGKPARLSCDKSLELRKSANGYEEVVAKLAGYLLVEGEKMEVKSELSVQGNLDYRYGNIDFFGSVVIGGDVLPGFSVRTRLGIQVRGNVERGTLESLSGGIVVGGVIFGTGGGRIVSSGPVEARAMEEANVFAKGAVSVKKDIRQSSVRTLETVSAAQGAIVGGTVFSVCGIEAKEFGNEVGTKTFLSLGSDVEASTEFAALKIHIEEHEKAIGLLRMHLGPYAERPQRLENLQSPLREKMKEIYAKFQRVEVSRLALVDKFEKMKASGRESQAMRVNVLKCLYPGATVRAGEATFSPLDAVQGPKTIEFDREKGEFQLGELKPLECRFDASNGKPEDKPEQGVAVKQGGKDGAK